MIVFWIVLLNWAIYQFLPVMRRDVFFAVRVSQEFRDSAIGRKYLAEFRYINLALALLTGAAMRFTFSLGGWWAAAGLTSGAIIQSVVMLGVLWWFRDRILPFAMDPVERRVSFPAEDEEAVFPVWMWLLSLLPLLLLFGAAFILNARWEEIPARFAVHWGLNGQPDRWTNKSARAVYGILLIGLSTFLMTYAPTLGAMLGARRTDGEARILRAFVYSMFALQTGIALLMAMIALQPLAGAPDQLQIPFPVLLAFPILMMGVAFVPMWWASRQEDSRDPTPEERWYAGKYYYNPADAAYMVRNRLGMGYSPNFGHRTVQIVLPFLILQFLATMYWVLG